MTTAHAPEKHAGVAPGDIPYLGICDFIAWRLDLFEAALARFFTAVLAADPEAKFAIGYRLRDDLALVTATSPKLGHIRLGAIAATTIVLPGFHPLRTQLWTLNVKEVAERGLRSCDVVMRLADEKKLAAAIRGALGMGSDRRAAFRLRVAIPLRIETPGGILEATTTDLSAGGLFITTQWPLDIGETLPITFFPKARRPVHGCITVVRHAAGGFGGRVELSIEGQADMYRRVRILLRPTPAQPLVAPISADKPAAAAPVPTSARALLGMGSQHERQQLAAALTAMRFDVLQTTTALDTFHALLDELLSLDLLVLDDTLPDLAVRELLFRIRQAGGETDLAVVVLSRKPAGLGDLAAASTVVSLDQPADALADQLQTLLGRHRQALLE